MTSEDTTLPRRLVLDQAWRAAGLAESVLSGRDGAPLARTVKCLIDPLIVRPKLNPELARPLLTEAGAAALTALVAEHAQLLWITDGWYEVLKRARRSRGIRAGNPQELYFPRAWELAHLHGPVADDPAAEAVAAEVLDEIHPPDDVDPATVTAHLDAVRDDLASQLADSWTAGPTVDATAVVAAVAAGIAVLVEQTGPAEGWSDPAWDDAAVADLGEALKQHAGVLAALAAALDVPAVALSAHDPLPAPPITASGPEALPLDRSLRTRVVAAARRGSGAVESTTEAELDRARSPFGLHAPALRATLVIGVVLAGQLRPLAAQSSARGPAREIEARLRKEAYVLHTRRLLAEGGPIHPAQQQVVDVLQDFAQPYLSRLWVRLHGLDVSQEAQDWQHLVTGIARSVSLDQRTRIRSALERVA